MLPTAVVVVAFQNRDKMAKLLSEFDDREIRDAIQLLADTFFDTPITYYKWNSTLDGWNEDKEDQNFESLQMKALVEYSKADDNKEQQEGSRNLDEVQLTLNIEDLERMEEKIILDDFTHTLSADKDYFLCKGKTYKVIDIYYDAPLSKKDVLLIVKGRISTRIIKFT